MFFGRRARVCECDKTCTEHPSAFRRSQHAGMTDSQAMREVGYRYFKVKIGPPTASCCDSPTQRILPECAGVSSSEPLRQHDLATACSRSLRRDTIIAAESWHQSGHGNIESRPPPARPARSPWTVPLGASPAEPGGPSGGSKNKASHRILRRGTDQR